MKPITDQTPKPIHKDISVPYRKVQYNSEKKAHLAIGLASSGTL